MSGFSERLSALRRGAGMTQAELAKKLGISKSSVSMYECGNREPEFDLLEKMADLLQVDMNVLLGRGEPLVNNDPELTAYRKRCATGRRCARCSAFPKMPRARMWRLP